MQFVFANLAVLEFPDEGGCAQGNLVHAIAAVDDQCVLGAEALQRAHLDADQVGMEHAHQHVRRAGRIGQRPEDVEDGLDAQFLAHRRDVLHRRVMVRREHETDADVGDALRDLHGRQVNVNAQRFQHIGTARLARHAAPAMLADLGAAGRCDEHRAGRDVEGVRTIAAGAHDIDQVRGVGHQHLGRHLAHHLRGSGDFADGFFLDAQAGDQRGHHHGRALAAHDEPHDVQHFVVEHLSVLDGALKRFLGSDGHKSFRCLGYRTAPAGRRTR